MSEARGSAPIERDLLLATLDMPTQERAAYLDQACEGREDLKARIRQLLENAGDTGSFMASPALDLSATIASNAIDVGTKIDRYRLMEQLGEGGMGVVYVAEQTEPVRRKVALKVIKPGMDSKAVIARFEAERQALAMMDHPNIARVLDAGTTGQRLPYFVMELVRGLPITQYCDQAKATIGDRLRLFVDVCSAVQHAHQKGIIHRDLKPSNILVTLHDGKPVVKVIDFGVAKALHQQLTQHTIYTAFNQVLGTPLYMSPEQFELSGLDIDTRTDVYSLGVLLYELLSGKTPFDRERLLKSGLDEMRRIIREEEAPRPSYRVTTIPKAELSTVAAQRGLDEREFQKSIRSELDWITLKALAKDRGRRYGSATEFAADVQRYLDDAPVLACPPSLWYSASKFGRKHRGLLTSAILLLAALIVGTAVSVNQAVRATKAERASDNRLQEISAEQTRTRNALIAVQAAETEQRRLREEAESLAQQAQQAALAEQHSRQQAEAATRQSQWELYVANMSTIQAAWKDRNYGRLEQLLDATIPAGGAADFRGWEWYYMRQCVESTSKTLPTMDDAKPQQLVSFHPTKNEFATFAPPSYIDIWDANKVAPLRRFDCQVPVKRIAWSPKGDRIAIGTTESCELLVLDSSDGRLVWRSQPVLPRKSDVSGIWIGGLSWHEDGDRIAVGSRYGDIAVVKLSEGSTALVRSANEDEYLGDLAWQPVNNRLVAGMRFGKRLILDTTDKSSKALTTHSLEIGFAVAWSPSGKFIATAEGSAIRIADDQGNDLDILRGHASQIDDLQWIDDRLLVSAARDHSVRLWDCEKQRQIDMWHLFDEPVQTLAVSPNGTKIVMGSATRIKITASRRNQDSHRFRIPDELGGFGTKGQEKNGITDLRWSSHGTQLFALGEVSHSSWSGGMRALLNPISLRALGINNTGLCKGMSLFQNSEFVLRGGVDNALRVDDARTGLPIQVIPCELFGEPIAIWSPTGKLAMTYHGPKPPLLRDGATSNVIQQWPPQIHGGMSTGAWDGSETKFISVGYGNPVLLGVDGTSRQFPDFNSFASFGVAWHPSGRIVAIGDVRGGIWIRDGNTMTALAQLRGHSGEVNGVDFSPDGRRLASASQDGTLRIWDVATGRELLQLTEPSVNGFSKITWSPDGSQLAAGTLDRQVVVFGNVGEQLTPKQTAMPVHGKIYQHFSALGDSDAIVKSVPVAPWREPLKGLLDRIDGTQPGDLPAIGKLIRQWFEPSLNSAETLDVFLTAGLCAIDGHQDDKIAKQIAEELIQVLLLRQEILGKEKTRQREVETRFRLCHRRVTSDSELTSGDEFKAAREASTKLVNEYPDNAEGWRQRLNLEILFVQSEVDRYLDSLKQAERSLTTQQLRQLMDGYADVIGQVPVGFLPFRIPVESQTTIDDWVAKITTGELRFGVPPTFSDEWLETFAKQVREGTGKHYPYYQIAIAKLVLDDREGYQQVCQTMLDRFFDTQDPLQARFAAWTACLAPEAIPDYSRALDLYKRLHAIDPAEVTLGAVLYRMREFEQAREELTKIAAVENPNSSPAYIWYFLAMTEKQLGNTEPAESWIKQADEFVADQLTQTSDEEWKTSWNRFATLRLLQREAKLILGGVQE